MKTDSLYAKILCLCFTLFLMFTAEGISRVFFHESRLDKILCILKEDPVLFWRQKPNLQVQFQGVEVRTDNMGLRNKRKSFLKASDTFRIVCLGASPTFGWGIKYEDTYPYQLERLLKKRGGGNFEVINAAIIGYTSYQGLIFLQKEIERLNPDLITVSYVLNDLDKYRFYRSDGKPDKELGPGNIFAIGARNTLSRSRFFKLLISFFAKKGRVVGNWRDLYYPDKLRVTPDDYRRNLQTIIDFAKERRIRVIFIKMPVNLPAAVELTELYYNKANKLLSRGIEYMESKRYDKAIEFFNKAKEYNRYSSRVFHYLGICFEKAGNVSEANKYFAQAKKVEAYRCGRNGIVYNAIMEDVAVKNDICLVDIVSAFQEVDKEYLFNHPQNDPIHPNTAGHKIISVKLYNALITNELLPGIGREEEIR